MITFIYLLLISRKWLCRSAYCKTLNYWMDKKQLWPGPEILLHTGVTLIFLSIFLFPFIVLGDNLLCDNLDLLKGYLSYKTIFSHFFWILSLTKMKLGHILVCYMKNISHWLNDGHWKLVPGPFMILSKSWYSEIWPFLIVDICQF